MNCPSIAGSKAGKRRGSVNIPRLVHAGSSLEIPDKIAIYATIISILGKIILAFYKFP